MRQNSTELLRRINQAQRDTGLLGRELRSYEQLQSGHIPFLDLLQIHGNSLTLNWTGKGSSPTSSTW